MKQIALQLKSFPYYVFGIIVFFLSHGYSENYGLIPLDDIFIFFISGSAAAILILYFFGRKMKSVAKGGLLTGLTLSFYLFYGAFRHMFIKSVFLFQLSHYRFLFSGMLIILVICYFFIKKSSGNFNEITAYANILVAILIVVDILSIVEQSLQHEDKDVVEKRALLSHLKKCDSCTKPDIYFIVMDEYWGNSSLKKYFNYDNHAFTSFLKNEGFFTIAEPVSNYSWTPISMASMLDMKYLEWAGTDTSLLQANDYGKAAKEISNNLVMSYLRSIGYQLKNCSIFDILGEKSKFDYILLPTKMRLITSKTLLNCVQKDLYWLVRSKFAQQVKQMTNDSTDFDSQGNNLLIRDTENNIAVKQSPKFVYTHLLMPHLPYLYDSLGNQNKLTFFKSFPKVKIDDLYLQYLVYCNSVVTKLIGKIKETSHGTAVIILMSDHGNRNFQLENKSVSASNNFNSIYLPRKNYNFFYDSISNVNEFRVLFNTLFNQHLPVLKDSVVF
ncbi:MAG TPA: hypothetical protein VMT76_09950 [Puia sp.]|nr:hypothetical protein [Puia sp.]